MKKIIFYLSIAIVLGSCITTRVKVNTNYTIYTSGIQLDTLNLVSVMFGPVSQPVFPLIDAAAFNEKTNSISDEIMNEQQKIIDEYRNLLVSSLNQKIPSTIVTSQNLTSEKADQYRVGSGVQIDNNHFPIVFFSEGDVNFIDFGKGKNVNAIFKENPELKTRIRRLSSELNLKTVVISYNRLAVVSAGMFGINGSLRLESYLFIYSSRGDLIMDAVAITKPGVISGKEISQYKDHLLRFNELTELISTELVKYIR